MSGGLSASWTERAGEEAGNVADYKTVFGYRVKLKRSIRAATGESVTVLSERQTI